MKAIATFLTWLLVAYLCTYFLLHIKYVPAMESPTQQQGFTPLQKMKTCPSRYDGVLFEDTLYVKQAGDPWLDLFNIHTFIALDRDGEEISVYQGSSIQNPDTCSVVFVRGIFELLENDTYTQEVCLFADMVKVMDSNIPAVKKFAKRISKNPKM